MKKTSFIILLTIVITSVCTMSCKKKNFLDDKSVGTITDPFSDSTQTMAFVNRLYEEIGFNFKKERWENGNTEQSTDDAEYTLLNPQRRTVALWLGNYNALDFKHGDVWSLPWVDIRRVNLILKNINRTPLSTELRKRITGEAKFMRAYFYQYLIANFGGVPLIGDAVYGIDDVINVPRNTYEECVNYIKKEYDEAAALLPAPNAPQSPVYDFQRDYGRATKGHCIGMKARLLLYAASPLFNGGVIAAATAQNKLLAGYPAYDVARWQAAADAANAVINSGYYSLHVNNTRPGLGFYELFTKRVNSEYIVFVNRPSNRDIEERYLPSSRNGGKHTQPTQSLVDCFPMKNGKAITDPTSGYNAQNPYVNRDPRFGFSIIYNQSNWLNSGGTYSAVITEVGTGQDNAPGGTFTGYYARKMCDTTVYGNGTRPNLTERGWPLLRYAEILLSYAEAINETGQTNLAYPKMIELRQRAGIDPGVDNLYGLKANMTVAEMRTVIRNERHIELAYEADNRWDDIRRLKTAEVVNNGNNTVIRITRVGSTLTYDIQTTATADRKHSFRPEMYLFPIPVDELKKMPLMIQNPGW
jgi:starch-binding outer membrane protein, SusD/RagB family